MGIYLGGMGGDDGFSLAAAAGGGVHVVVIVVHLQLLDSAHDFDSAPKLDAQALDECLMSQQKESNTVHFLCFKQVHIAFAVGGGLEILHHLAHRPLTNVRGQTYISI